MEWVSSKELMEAMGAPQLAACSDAAQRICKRARAGLLRAKAKRFLIDDESRADFEVPPAFWWAEGHEALEQDWHAGDFVTWEDRRTKLRAFGVEWHKGDAEAAGADFGGDDFLLDMFDLAPQDREIGDRWAERPFLTWLDAAAWVGARNSAASKTLAIYREHLTLNGRLDSVGRGAVALVANSLIGYRSVKEGERLLTAALQSGGVQAFGSRTSDGAMELIERTEWARPFAVHYANGDCLTGPKIPWPIHFHNLTLDAASIFAEWPVPADDTKPAKVSHPSNKAADDAPLVDEMRQMIEAGTATSRWNAALSVVDRATGGGNTESKARRLSDRYKEKFGA